MTAFLSCHPGFPGRAVGPPAFRDRIAQFAGSEKEQAGRRRRPGADEAGHGEGHGRPRGVGCRPEPRGEDDCVSDADRRLCGDEPHPCRVLPERDVPGARVWRLPGCPVPISSRSECVAALEQGRGDRAAGGRRIRADDPPAAPIRPFGRAERYRLSIARGLAVEPRDRLRAAGPAGLSGGLSASHRVPSGTGPLRAPIARRLEGPAG